MGFGVHCDPCPQLRVIECISRISHAVGIAKRIFQLPRASAVTPPAGRHDHGLLQVFPLGTQNVNCPSHVGERLFKLAVHAEILRAPVFGKRLGRRITRRLGARPAFAPAQEFAQLIAKEDAELSGLMEVIGLKKQP